jgi:hypothetical protein
MNADRFYHDVCARIAHHVNVCESVSGCTTLRCSALNCASLLRVRAASSAVFGQH